MNAQMEKLEGMVVLVTGAAGFIGFHLSMTLLKANAVVIGYDNINDYYSQQMKRDRLNILSKYARFTFHHADLEDKETLHSVFTNHHPRVVVHLAAQAGVRYSIENPDVYIQSNIVGTLNILECCRHHNIEHLLYASSSSVYGSNKKLPFAVGDNVDTPISLYAATKRSDELMAYTYSHLFNLRTTGLRFFTVYGPWGRPDMAAFLFLDAITKGNPIKVYNYGKMRRDFTYIDDIVDGIVRLIITSQPESGEKPPYRLYNIGNNNPEELADFIAYLEEFSGQKAKQEYLPIQPGDIPATYADIEDLKRDVGFLPRTSLKDGLRNFVNWYKEYFHIEGNLPK